jgi:O-acetyl-ADP-ribose deacetylase (regulator of RNase III)
LTEGNIAAVEADAVVNAANKTLVLGSGVAGAIRRFGGPSIQEECNRIGPIRVGEAVMTGAGDLKARHVIHAAGPVYGEGDENEKLERATLNSLRLAGEHRLVSIAFPALSTGVFGFPIQRCSEIMLGAAMQYLRGNEFPTEVIFCLYGDDAYRIFADTLTRLAETEAPPDASA